MFNFFKDKKWLVWSYFGGATIIAAMWYQVQLDVKINEWFGTFYNMIQQALAEPNSITMTEYFGTLWTFAGIAGI
jgi:peptide/bleomycin uptake transporter